MTVKPKNFKTLISCLTLAVLLIYFIIVGCGKRTQPSQTEKRKIAVLQFGGHQVIDAVVQGLEERTTQLFKNVELIKYNGNFDMQAIGILSDQMVASDAEILVGVTTPASGRLVGANRGSKPMVFTFVSDPADIGFEVPDGLPNTTGLSDKVNYHQTLKLIRQVMPGRKKIGYLLTRNEANAISIHKGFKAIQGEYGFEIITATIGSANDIRIAAESIVSKVDVFLFGGDNNIASAIEILIEVAKSKKIPVFACDELSIKRGALAGYTVDYVGMGRRTAEICAIILAGASPSDIPVEKYTASNLILNVKVAEELGIIFPNDIKEDAVSILE